jgi:hypothetical protein
MLYERVSMVGVVIGVMAGLAAVGVVGGCGSLPEVDYARQYPAQLSQRGSVNIQVFQTTKELELTNTTARAFGPCTLWLNQRFSRPLEGLAVGESLRISLEEFRDEYGDNFKPGGFFATAIPTTLVHAQLESPRTQDEIAAERAMVERNIRGAGSKESAEVVEAAVAVAVADVPPAELIGLVVVAAVE